MSSRLEEKLKIYDPDSTIDNDKDLLKVLDDIIADEESKDVYERDFDLIDEALDLIFAIRGTNTEKIDKCAEDISEKCIAKARLNQSIKKNRNYITRKLCKIVPLAAVIALFISTTLTLNATKYDFINEAFSWLKEKIYGQEDISTAGSFKEYDTLEELSADSVYNFALLPQKLPDSFKITQITAQTAYVKESVDTVTVYKSIDIRMLHSDTLLTLNIETPAIDLEHDENTVFIDDYSVLLSHEKNRYEGKFLHNGSLYTISASSYEILVSMIGCLK